MASVAAAQAYKKRCLPTTRTEAMARAERHNGRTLDRIWAKHKFQAEKRESTSNFAKRLLLDEDCSAGSNKDGEAMPLLQQSLLQLQHSGDDETDNDSQEPAFLPENECSSSEKGLLRLNVGGVPFILLVDSIKKSNREGFLTKFSLLPHKDRIKVADAWMDSQKAYYFQRSPLAFDCIYQFYATGVVHKPPEMCPSEFTAELEFWRVPSQAVGSCCSDAVTTIFPHERLIDEQQEDDAYEKAFDDSCFLGKEFRRRLWIFLEKPSSSSQARACELISTMFVVISVVGLSLGTVPDFQVTEWVDSRQVLRRLSNETTVAGAGRRGQFTEVRTEHPIFLLVERICIAFFTAEYVLRIFAAPQKLAFALKPLNLVDLLAIFPFYVELVVTALGVDETKLRDLRWAFLVLGRFSSGLQTFAMTLKRSQKQLQMMTIVLLTGVVFFSTLIYFLEKDEQDTPFTSIPAAYWWCIVTMTTVGYGDVVPTTNLGKLIASVAIMCGVLVLALPITIIVDNFIKVAQEEQQLEQLKAELLARKEREWKRSLVVVAETTATPVLKFDLHR